MLAGARGTISVAANVAPRLFAILCERALSANAATETRPPRLQVQRPLTGTGNCFLVESDSGEVGPASTRIPAAATACR